MHSPQKNPTVVNHIITQENLQEIYGAISILFNKKNVRDFNTLAAILEEEASSDFNEYLLNMKAASKLLCIRNILPLEKLTQISNEFGICKPVQFSAPVLHVSGQKLCPGSSGVSIHQDWPSTLGSYNSIIIWISLGGSNADGGGLNFYTPKNDFIGIINGSADKNVVSIEGSELTNFEKNYLHIEAGDALIFGHFLPHSSENKNTRLSISIRIEDAADPYWKNRKYNYAQETIINRKTFCPDEIKVLNAQIKSSQMDI